MSNGTSGIQALVSVPVGGVARASLALPSSHVCQLPRAITFESARSFVEPTPDNKAAFQDLITRLGIGGTHNRLLITGHTDSLGDQVINQQLSLRRAQAVDAVLQGNASQWETIFGVEGWGTPELTAMVSEVGETDVSPYRGSAKLAARLDLYRRYFARLLGGATVPSITPTTPPLLDCGENQLLRGSCASPSRDTSLPPIEGDCRTNRRSEFFFFDSAGSTIACSEYPTWTGACSLTPPSPTITVTIASVETISKGAPTDIQVTINPSPLPFGTQISLTLSTTSGAGAAKFVSNNSTTLIIRSSGPVTVRGVTASSELDNLRLSATVVGQSTVLAQEDFTVVEAISIFLQFEVMNLTTLTFEPLPAGVDVDLMDRDPLSNDLIATRQTDARGRVFFNLPDLSASGEPTPDIFFLVHTNGRSHAGHTLPGEWSTDGWLAADNTTTGLQSGFTGPSLGSPSSPVVFRIGLDFHGEIKYHVDAGSRAGNDDPAPFGVLVKLMQEETGPDRELLVLRTDGSGKIRGVSFNAEPGRTFYLHVVFEMEDSSINLKRTRFSEVPLRPPIVDIITPAGPTLAWDTNDSDNDKKDFPNHRRSSIGAAGSPELFLSTINDRNVALYILKVLRELGIFLFKMTQGDWGGVAVVVTPTAPVTAFSWPVGRIQLKFPDDRWDRETVTHEMGHQVMWKEVNFGSLGVGYEATLGDLALFHREDLLSNQEHALIEGWAEFVEAIFEGAGTPPFSVLSPVDTSGNAVAGGLGPPPLDQGESVEGALANGLWAIFENHVAARRAPLNARVPESVNGDVTVTAPWIGTAAVQTRFLSMIWRPLKDLRPLSNPNSTDLLAKIRSRTPNDWHLLLPELQAFNMAMLAPTATNIEPNWGPVAGGLAIGLVVTITGTDFIQRTTASTSATTTTVLEATVEFGGTLGTGVIVDNSTSVKVVPPPRPLAPGFVNVVVTTPGGSSTPPLQFAYIDDPLLINDVTAKGAGGALTPRVVSTRGDGSFEIHGQGFLPGAIVEIDGVQVTSNDVKVRQPDLIEVVRTPVRAPGVVAVAVVNPDAAFDVLNGRLRFADPPTVINMLKPVSRSGPADQNNEIIVLGQNIHSNATVTEGTQTFLVTLAPTSSGTEVKFILGPGSPGLVTFELENPNDGLSVQFDFLREGAGP